MNRFFYGIYTAASARVTAILCGAPDNAPMKKLSTLNAFTTHPLRGIGLIAAIALFSLAVFRLVHLPAASMDHDFLDLWRGLAVGSLYLLFCLSTDHRSHSDF
jgi:hypothetical protein